MYYASEFSQIMGPITRNQEIHVSPDKYKERNPRTWKENQVEDSSSYLSRMLYSLFKGLEPSKEAEEFEKLWNKSEIKRRIEKEESERNGK